MQCVFSASGETVHSLRRLARFTLAPWKPFPMPGLYHALRLVPTLFPGLSALEDEKEQTTDEHGDEGPRDLIQGADEGGREKEYSGEGRKVHEGVACKKFGGSNSVAKRGERATTLGSRANCFSAFPPLSSPSRSVLKDERADDTEGHDSRSSRGYSGSLVRAAAPGAKRTKRRTTREKRAARLEQQVPTLAEFWVWCNYRWAYGEEGCLSADKQPSRRALRRLMRKLRRGEAEVSQTPGQEEARGSQGRAASQSVSGGEDECSTVVEKGGERREEEFPTSRPENGDCHENKEQQPHQCVHREKDENDGGEGLAPAKFSSRRAEEKTCDFEVLDSLRAEFSSLEQEADGDAEDLTGTAKRKAREEGEEEEEATGAEESQGAVQLKLVSSVETTGEKKPVEEKGMAGEASIRCTKSSD